MSEEDYWRWRNTDSSDPSSPAYSPPDEPLRSVSPFEEPNWTPPPPTTELELSPMATVAVTIVACLGFLVAIGDQDLAIVLAGTLGFSGLVASLAWRQVRGHWSRGPGSTRRGR